MMNIPIITYPHFRFDTVEIAARKQVKRSQLHEAWQEEWANYYRIKQQDAVQSKQRVKQFNFIKDIEQIKAYDALKKSIEYGMYRYNTSLGRNLDVYI